MVIFHLQIKMVRPIRHVSTLFHIVAFPDQFPYLNHVIQHELLHLQIKSHSELSLIICTLSSTLQTHTAK